MPLREEEHKHVSDGVATACWAAVRIALTRIRPIRLSRLRLSRALIRCYRAPRMVPRGASLLCRSSVLYP